MISILLEILKSMIVTLAIRIIEERLKYLMKKSKSIEKETMDRYVNKLVLYRTRAREKRLSRESQLSQKVFDYEKEIQNQQEKES